MKILFKNILSVKIAILVFAAMFIGTASFADNKPGVVVLSHHKSFNDGLTIVGNFMTENKYDSAYIVLSQLKPEIEASDFKIAKYYLYAFESEIFYYNSLFNEGLNSAYSSLGVAEELSNPLFVGSSKNLIGLNLFNLHHYKDAEKYLKEAVNEIPLLHADVNLSYRYHAAANLCELYLAMGRAKEAIVAAKMAMYEAKLINAQRSQAINYWNLAKAESLLGNYQQAMVFVKAGEEIAHKNGIKDVLLFFRSLRIENLAKQQQAANCIQEIKGGLLFIEQNEQLTAYSKVDFLKLSIGKLLKFNEIILASKAQVMLDVINGELNEWRNVVQLNMLQEAQQNEKKLIESEFLRKETLIQSRFNTYMLYGVIVVSVLLLFIIGLSVYSYVQKQNAKTSELKRQAELLEATKEIEKTEERIQSAIAERTRIAKELHDDIGSTVSSISLFTQMAINKANTKDSEIVELLERVNKNTNSLAETMSDIIWAVYSKNDDFNNLILRMKDFAFELLRPLNIEVEFTFPDQLSDMSLHLEQRKNVYYIFKEALNNAVKHSACSTIKIKFMLQENRVRVSIADNGKGFNPATVKRNNGLYHIQSRAHDLNGTVQIDSAFGGTQVIVNFELA